MRHLHSEKIIQQGCHGVAIFGSTGQAQLISVAEKIDLLKVDTQGYEDKVFEGTINNLKNKKVGAVITEIMFDDVYHQLNLTDGGGHAASGLQ